MSKRISNELGIFTQNDYTKQTAEEVYEGWLKNRKKWTIEELNALYPYLENNERENLLGELNKGFS